MSGLVEIQPAVVTRLRAAGCVFAEEEAEHLAAAARDAAELEAMVQRRVAGLPLEHIVGWAAFAGLRIAVEEGVFVPRHRTELLAREASARGGPRSVVLDLCCGSGAVGVAIASVVEQIELHAADLDPVAVRCARRNVEPIGGTAYQGDLFEPVPKRLRGRVDVLIANVPYVPTSAIEFLPPEFRLHEARMALDGGADGLDVFRRVAAEAGSWLAPQGRLYVEMSEDQAPIAAEVMNGSGMLAEIVFEEEVFVVIGQAPAR